MTAAASRLSGSWLRDAPSPNQDSRPDGTPIDILVLHYTGMLSAQDAIDRLRDPAARVSSHYVVEEDGLVWRLVDEHRRAFHAGVSWWRGHEGLNDRSIGVELVNPGHAHGYRPFPALQMAALCELCLGILGRHDIPARNVVGHSDVAPDRKEDPGELFDWPGLARNGVGLWPEDAADLGTADGGSSRSVRADLAAIGYRIAVDGAGDDPALATVVRAFQRHWRPGSVTGRSDVGTVARVRAIAGLCLASDERAVSTATAREL